MQTIDIMPLGDSITRGEGSLSSGGYRGHLTAALLHRPYLCRLVGSQIDDDPVLAAMLGNHEGHNGWRAADFQGLIGTILDDYSPHVILCHLGTNNLPFMSTEAACLELAALLDAIHKHAPATWIVVGSLVDFGGTGPWVSYYRREVLILLHRLRLAGRRVLLADTGEYCAGRVVGAHPTPEGYAGMATAWMAALDRLLPCIDGVI